MPQVVLLIHDDAAKANRVRNSLRNSVDGLFTVEWVERCADGVRRLRKEGAKRIAAVLVNLFLPDCDGIQTFDRLFLASPEVPILVLSSLACEGSARLAVQRGAQDYLLDDDLDGYLLPKAVRNMIERTSNVEALFREKERAQVTLNSIGDAVVSTDIAGNVTFLNPIARDMTGWSAAEAVGRPFEEVFRILDVSSGNRVANPMMLVIQENQPTKLPANCKLIRLDGTEFAIEDSAAPIHDRRGSVTGAVMVFHDMTQAQAVSKKMSHLALHDYLTDLPNRILLNDRLSQAISAAGGSRQKLAILCIDIDRFKHVNDSLGHVVGDKLLLSVAGRLVASVRSSDTVSRQGGDEFVILLSSVTNAEEAALSAQKILTVVGMPHALEEHGNYGERRNRHLSG
jgi:diguanylate cyclase (GGDEF)-like protein/PAS domain S-box-containing protein